MEREEADLYGLPLDEFIPARTELERRLRKEGARERAAAVKKLPKPSVAAWGVNQASRSQPQARRDLIEASDELRDVQERLIAGDATGAELESAVARQRTAIDALVDAAAGLLTSDGKSLGDATLARVRETFAAVASDPELAELVEAGAVDRERQPAGLGFPFGAGVPEAPEPAPARARRGSGAGRSPGRGGEAASEDARRRERELKAAREEVKAAKAAEKEAARRRKAAEREAKQAAKELERAERAAEKARASAEEARTELDAATAAADEAERAREAAEAALDDLG